MNLVCRGYRSTVVSQLLLHTERYRADTFLDMLLFFEDHRLMNIK